MQSIIYHSHNNKVFYVEVNVDLIASPTFPHVKHNIELHPQLSRKNKITCHDAARDQITERYSHSNFYRPLIITLITINTFSI